MRGKLEKEIEALLGSGKHDTALVPRHRHADPPKQLDLFDPHLEKHRRKKLQMDLNFHRFVSRGVEPIYFADSFTVSTFYETLSAAFYGGFLCQGTWLKLQLLSRG
ncbi:hypothetical protein FJZ18_04475 [Candidatus Pacearchaeota archaeon]|nr:hypothetical protein [Candidatus Pacearchaeota archaeon]